MYICKFFVNNNHYDSFIFLQNVALNAKVPKRRAVCLMVVLVFLIINVGSMRWAYGVWLVAMNPL